MLNQTKKLNKFKEGDTGVVLGYQPGRSAYRQRLLAMGLLPGTGFEITRVAPLGDPIEMTFRGTSLSLRRQEIDILQIDKNS